MLINLCMQIESDVAAEQESRQPADDEAARQTAHEFEQV